MKKFVSIVLALALALSLCTVAFAGEKQDALAAAEKKLAADQAAKVEADAAKAEADAYLATLNGYTLYNKAKGNIKVEYQWGYYWFPNDYVNSGLKDDAVYALTTVKVGNVTHVTAAEKKFDTNNAWQQEIGVAQKAADEAAKVAEDLAEAVKDDLADVAKYGPEALKESQDETAAEAAAKEAEAAKKTIEVTDEVKFETIPEALEDYVYVMMDVKKDVAYGDAIKSVEASKTTKDGKFVKGTIAYKELGVKKYVEVESAADADAVLYKDGKVFAYVVLLDDGVEYEYTGAKFTNYGDKCGMYKEETGKTYYAVDGEKGLWEKDAAGKGVLVGNKVIKMVKTDKDVVAHNYQADTTVTKVGGVEKLTVTKVYCTKCNKEFAFQTSYAEAVKAFGVDNFKSLTVKVGTLSKVVYIELDAAQVATNADKTVTTVDSSKTFDAGVATYAVLSLASVAGSAVVIGKKKEF